MLFASDALKRHINMNSLEIIKPGPLCLLQDMGRRFAQHFGYTASGAADEHAFLWANRLVNNPMKAAALEVTLGPAKFRFNHDAHVAITGAAQHFWLNKYKHASWESIHVSAGDTIALDMPVSGLKTYLSVGGGFSAPLTFASASMVTREESGPFLGKPLTCGQIISYTSSNYCRLNQSTPACYIPDYTKTLTLRFHRPPNAPKLNNTSQRKLLSNQFSIHKNASRMAYPLVGERLQLAKNVDKQISSGVALGCVQLPTSGEPFILLKDRQTIGGYPVIGYISHRDCFALSQRRPGQNIRFIQTNIEVVQKELREFYTFFQN